MWDERINITEPFVVVVVVVVVVVRYHGMAT
jgi:hypothetical protein